MGVGIVFQKYSPVAPAYNSIILTPRKPTFVIKNPYSRVFGVGLSSGCRAPASGFRG